MMLFDTDSSDSEEVRAVKEPALEVVEGRGRLQGEVSRRARAVRELNVVHSGAGPGGGEAREGELGQAADPPRGEGGGGQGEGGQVGRELLAGDRPHL